MSAKMSVDPVYRLIPIISFDIGNIRQQVVPDQHIPLETELVISFMDSHKFLCDFYWAP